MGMVVVHGILASASTYFITNDSPQRTTVWLLAAWEFRVISVFYTRLGHRRHLLVFISLDFLAVHQHCVSLFTAANT